MISREILEQLNLPALKEVCREYNLAISGKKTELFERIIAHQEKLEKQKADKLQRLAYGAKEGDGEFEATIMKFLYWCEKNNYTVNEMAENGCSYRPVHHCEIRAAFKDYDPAASTLRDDHLVPVPHTKMEIFLEMFFDKLGGEWEMFRECSDERGEEDFSESDERKFVQEMKRSTETTVSQWCATGYANNRD
tara:strand:- start:534 stop:1112 length:579 start_codon:yes stop_codon:yes gene_type:complete